MGQKPSLKLKEVWEIPHPAATWQAFTGTGLVQPSHRQQTPGLRLGKAKSQGCRPWRPNNKTRDGSAAKDTSTCPV